MAPALLSGERFPHVTLASFGARDDAEKARVELTRALDASEARVRLVGADEDPATAMQPDSRGIARTVVRAHGWLGLIGALAGGLAFLLLRALMPLPQWGEGYAGAAALVVLGAFAGLMLGGLLSLRPDQDHLLVAMREAQRAGRLVLVVHARQRESMTQAHDTMERLGGEALRSL